MKLSTLGLIMIVLGLFASFTYISRLIPVATPTSIISVPLSPRVRGGGYTVSLPANITRHQAEILAMAYLTAKDDGLPYPQLLQGILLQESKAGHMASYKVAGQGYGLKPNERYYGVGQLKLAAARDVLQRYPVLWDQFSFQTHTDEEIIAKLIDNDAFNISIASKYLVLLRAGGYTNPAALAVAYNKGMGGARGINPSKNGYSLSVAGFINKLNLSNKATQASMRSTLTASEVAEL